MHRPSTLALKCPVCHRDVAPMPIEGIAEQALQARDLFIRHADRQHGVGELDALMFYAEALRRRAKL
ncbi:MAG: hypothetical protein JST54_18800 [Deltaproteobacteria bacterium]|nr:hypothetical protein [Deltaproteobacteria bacterium]